MVLTSGEVAMSQSMISFLVGIAALPCIVIFAAARYRREHKDDLVVRWLDTHLIGDGMHHKH